MTAWALHLGCSSRVIGILGALPFLAQLCQPAAAWLTARLGARPVALWTVAASRQAFLPLVLLPWLPLDPGAKRAVLLACCGLHHVLGILCNNAWVTWIGDLVPERIRGRYFGRRTSITTTASALATVVVGLGLDRARAASLGGPALAALAAVACVAGALSVSLMARQAGGIRSRDTTWSVAATLAPLADVRARRLLAYLVLWNAAIGFSAPFFGLYVLLDLRAGFTTLAASTAASALARTVTAPAWGRLVDRTGARGVLVGCTTGLALMPLAWISAAWLGPWPLVLDALVGGALLGGHGVATFTLPLALAPARERPHYHAAFAMAGGAAFGAASACGGALVAAGPRLLDRAPGGALPMHLTFAASLAVRLVAAGASLAILGASRGAYRSAVWDTARPKSERPLSRPHRLWAGRPVLSAVCPDGAPGGGGSRASVTLRRWLGLQELGPSIELEVGLWKAPVDGLRRDSLLNQYKPRADAGLERVASDLRALGGTPEVTRL